MAIFATAALVARPGPASADSFTDFEPAGFVAGASVHDLAPDGTGPVGISFVNNCVSAWFVPTAGTDEEVVDLSTVPAQAGLDAAGHGKVWRLSNAVDGGSLGQNTHSPNSGDVTPLTAGETGAMPNDAGCGAPTTDTYYAEFDFRTVTGGTQMGMTINVNANSGDTRHAYVRIADNGVDGLDLTFFETGNGCDFPSAPLATSLSYTDWHRLGIEIFFADGLAAGTAPDPGATGNDVVNIYIDGILAHTGTSWESCVDARSVDRIMFETGDPADAAHEGNGLYFDNVLVAETCPPGHCEEEGAAPDHYLLYDVRPVHHGSRRHSEDPVVDLVDQFGASQKTVRRPKYLGVPVDKNGEGITDPETHLVCYDLGTPRGVHPQRPIDLDVEVTNQFTDGEELRVRRPQLLCVPSTKEVIDGVIE